MSAEQDYRTYALKLQEIHCTDVFEQGVLVKYEGWNFNSGNYLFTTDTK